MNVTILQVPNSLVSGSDIISPRTAEGLNRNGIRCNLVPLFSDFVVRMLWNGKLPFRRRLFKYLVARKRCRNILRQVNPGDWVWVSNEAYPFDPSAWFEKALLRKNAHYIYHLVDDLFAKQNPIPETRIPLACLVVVNTESLKQKVLDRYPDANVVCLEEPVDTTRLYPNSHVAKDPKKVIWAGSQHSLQEDFSPFIPFLEAAYAEESFALKIVSGHRRPDITLRIPWTWEPYCHAREAEQYAGYTIALAPLLHSTYNCSKGTYKIKVYMSMEMVTVASAVGKQRELLQDGITGMLANDFDALQSALLRTLRLHPDDSRKIAVRARQKAVAAFSHEALVEKWALTLNNIGDHQCAELQES